MSLVEMEETLRKNGAYPNVYRDRPRIESLIIKPIVYR